MSRLFQTNFKVEKTTIENNIYKMQDLDSFGENLAKATEDYDDMMPKLEKMN